MQGVMKMFPHNVILLEAFERQQRDRIQKEAENARLLRRLFVKDVQVKEVRAKKPATKVELEEAHA
jgi:hypothetical protein